MAEDNQFPLLDVVRTIPKQATFLDIVKGIGQERRAEALPGSANEPAGELAGATVVSALTPGAFGDFPERATASIMKLFNMDGADLASQYVIDKNREQAEAGGVRDSFGRSLAGMVTSTVRGATAMTSEFTKDYVPIDAAEGFARGMGTGSTMRSDAVTDKLVSAVTQGVGNIAIGLTPGLNLAAVPLFFLQGAGGAANEYDQAFVENKLVDKSGKYNALNKFRAAVKGGVIEGATEWVGAKSAAKIGKTVWGAAATQSMKEMNPALRFAFGMGLAYGSEAFEEGLGSVLYSATKGLQGEESPTLGKAASDAVADAFYGGFGGAGAHPFIGIAEGASEKIMRNRISESIRNSNNAFSDPEFWDRMPQATVDSLRTMTPAERDAELQTAQATHQQADLDRQVGADNLNKASMNLEATQKALSKAERSKSADKITAATDAVKAAQDNYDTAFNAQSSLAAELVSARTRLFTVAAFNARNAPTVEADAASVLKGEKKTLAAASTEADEAAATELRNLGYDIEFFTPDSADNTDPAFYHPATPNTVYLRSGLEQGDIAKVMGFAYHEVMHIVQATDGKLYNALRASFDEVSTVEAGAQYFNDAMRSDDQLAQNANATLRAELEGQTTQPVTQEGALVQRAGRTLLAAEGEARNLEDGIRELFRTGKAPGFLGKLIVRMGLRGKQAATALRVRSLLLASAEQRIAARTGAKPALTETGLQIEEAKGIARVLEMMQTTAAPAAAPSPAPAPTPAPSGVPGAPAAPSATAAPTAPPSAPSAPAAPTAGTVSGLSPADAALAGTPGFTAMVDLAAERIRKSQPKWAEGKPLYKIAERMEREPALLSPQEQQIGNKLRNEMKSAFGPDYTSLWARARSDTNRGRRLVADAIRELKLTEEEVKSTVLDFMTGKSKQDSFVPQDIGGIPDTIKWLHERRLASGLPKFDLTLEEDREALSRLLATEALAAIRSSGESLEWYDKTIRNTIAQAAIKFPELNTDPKARLAFLMAVAISSQALNVEVNLAFATKQYSEYRKTVSKKTGYGQFKVKGKGKNGDAQRKNFKLANKMLVKVGPEKLIRFLRTQFTAGQLNKAGLKVGGELQTELVLGSAIFGPKIGFGFLSNLDGNFDPVTMDMWFMRLVGRLSGTLPAFNPKTFAKQVKRFRTGLYAVGRDGVYSKEFSKKMVADAKNEKLGDGPVLALAREVLKFHEKDFKANRPAYKSGKRVQSEMVRAAKTIIKSFDKPRDSPKSGGERRILRDVVRRSVEKLNALHGSPVPNAAFQALVWYPEQELYKSLGVKLTVTSQDYSGAMRKMLLKEGFKNEELDAAISTAESRSRKAQQVARKSVGRANGRDGGGASRTRGLGEQSKADFLANAGTYARIRTPAGRPTLRTTSTEIVDRVVSAGGKFAELVKLLNESILDSREAFNATRQISDGKTREDRAVTVLVYPKVRAHYTVALQSISIQENEIPPSLLGSTELRSAASNDVEYVFPHELVHAATSTKLYEYEERFLKEESQRLGFAKYSSAAQNFEKKARFSDKSGQAYITALENFSTNLNVDPAIKELIDCFLESAKASPAQFQVMTKGKRANAKFTYTGNKESVTVEQFDYPLRTSSFDPNTQKYTEVIKPTAKWKVMASGQDVAESWSEEEIRKLADDLKSGKAFKFDNGIKVNSRFIGASDRPFTVEPQFTGQGSVNKRQSGDEMVSRGALYEFANLDEFLAGAMSDRVFQGMLQIMPSKGRGGNMFQRFVTAIRNLLKIPVERESMLTDVVRLTEEIASIPVPDMRAGRRPVVPGEIKEKVYKPTLKLGFPIKGLISDVRKSDRRSYSANNPAYNQSQLYEVEIIGDKNGGYGFNTLPVFKGDDGQWRLDTDTYSSFQWNETRKDTGESFGFDQPLGKTKEQAIDKILEFHDKWTDYLVSRSSGGSSTISAPLMARPARPRSSFTPKWNEWFGDSKVVDENGNPLLVYHATKAAKDFSIFKFTKDLGFHFASTPVAANRALTSRVGGATQSGGSRIYPAYLSIKNPLRIEETGSRMMGDLGGWNFSDLVRQFYRPVKLKESNLFKYEPEANEFDVPEGMSFAEAARTGQITRTQSRPGLINMTPLQYTQKINAEIDAQFGPTTTLAIRIKKNKSALQKIVADFKALGYDGFVYKNIIEGGGDSWIALEANQIKSAFNENPTAAPGILNARSRKTDADYMAAVESGDMETAQRMVDDAAKAAGYTISAKHGSTTPNIREFDFKQRRSRFPGLSERGVVWFSDNDEAVGRYASISGYINVEQVISTINEYLVKPRDGGVMFRNDDGSYDGPYPTYSNASDDLSVFYLPTESGYEPGYYAQNLRNNEVPSKIGTTSEDAVSGLRSWLNKQTGLKAPLTKSEVIYNSYLKLSNPLEVDFNGQEKTKPWNDIVAQARNNLHDGVVVRNVIDVPMGMLGLPNPIENYKGTVYGIFSPQQAKSADPVTRDESGNVIPLSQRFDSGSMDIMRARHRDVVAGFKDDPNFKEYFGDSKVVDAEGNPLVVYHGTSKDMDFSTFRVGMRGAWFSSNPDDANMYAATNDSQNYAWDYKTQQIQPTNTRSRVMPVVLSIKNPKLITDADMEELRQYDMKGESGYIKGQRLIFERYRREGYDGVNYGNGVWVAFDQKQIKSIYNRGTWSSKTGNIMKARERGPTGQRADDAARAIFDTAKLRLSEAIATKDTDKIAAARKVMMSAVRGLRRKVAPIDPLGLASEMGRRSGQAAGVAKGRVEGVREEAKKQRAMAVASRNELRSKFKSRVAQLFDRIEAAADKNDELRNRMRIMKKYEGLYKEVAADKAARRVLKAWFAGQQKGSAIGAKSERAEMISLRKEAAMAIASLPPSMRGKYINAVATMRTPSGIARIARRVVRDLALAESIETVSDINRMIKRVKKVGLRAETRKDILTDLMSARGLLAAGRKRMLPFTNTADVAARTLAAQQLLESARNQYDVERAEYRDIRDERAIEAELDASAFNATLSVLPSVEEGRLSSMAPQRTFIQDILSNYANADIYTIMQAIEGGANGILGKIWNTISTAKGNMIKERRSIDNDIDGYLRSAGYDGYDGYATTAAGLYGDSSAQAVNVTLGGKPQTITMDQFLHLAAFDTSTVALLTDDRQPDVKGAGIVFGTYRDAKPTYFTRQEFEKIRASLTPDQIALIDNMKLVLENRIRPAVFEIYFQIHGRQPNMEDLYFPRKRLGDEIGDGAIDVNATPSAIVGGMLANAGFMRNREASKATLVVGGMMRVMDDHVEESLRLIYLSLPLRYALKVLKDVRVRSEIVRSMGADANDSIRKLVLNGVGLSGRPVGGFVEAINTNVSGALITLNPKTWLRQSGGVARLASELPSESLAAGVAEMSVMTPAARKQLAIEIEQTNGYFYDRHRRSQVGIFANVLGSESASKDRWANALRSSARSLSMVGEDIAAGKFNRAARDIKEGVIPISKVMKSADGMLRMIDRQIMITAYLAALNSVNRSNPTMPVEEKKIAAAKLAENAFRKTQNVSDPLDDTVYAARQKFSQGLGRLMFPFSSDPLKGYNQVRRAIASRDPSLIARTAAGVAGNVTTSLAVNVLWSAAGIAIAQAVGGGSGNEDDDEMIARMARERQYNNLLPNLAQDLGPLAFGYLGSAAGAIVDGAIGSPERADDVMEPLVIRFIGDTTQYLAKGQIRTSASSALQMLGVPVVAPFSSVTSVAREANPGDTKLLKRYRELNKAGQLNPAQRVRMEVLAQRERIRLAAERIAKEMEAAK